MRARAAALAAKQDALQRKCAAFELPWEPQLLRAVAGNAMHLATLYMSRCVLLKWVRFRWSRQKNPRVEQATSQVLSFEKVLASALCGWCTVRHAEAVRQTPTVEPLRQFPA